MCKLVEELVVKSFEKGQEGGREENNIKIIKSMLSKNKYSYEEIADITDVSVEEVKKIAEELYA